MTTLSTPVKSSMLQLDGACFRYEPFPIGVARPAFEPAEYEELLENWPPHELFAYMPKLGKKFSLSEVNEPGNYREFIETTPIWRRFHREIKSASFVHSVIDMLARKHIELNIVGGAPVNAPPIKKRWFSSGENGASGGCAIRALKSRFEFSMLPADGGHIKPHTDSPGKIITLVVSMVGPDEWDQAWGGGTTVLRAKDFRQSFNYMNRQLEFDQTDVLDTFEFQTNQCVVFIKTFNSLHAVSPLAGVGVNAMRKTLTINIEAA